MTGWWPLIADGARRLDEEMTVRTLVKPLPGEDEKAADMLNVCPRLTGR